MLSTCITAALLSIPPYLLIKYLNNKSQEIHKLQKKVDENEYKHMFITHKNRLCSPHLNTRLICGSNCSYLYLKNIVNMINQAKESLSVGMYHFCIDDLYFAVLNAHHRGVEVRIITDVVMVSSSGSRINDFARKGLPVKTQKSKVGLMHHKFLLIDENNIKLGRVLYGSLNYTLNAVINNWEYVILTNSDTIVKGFRDEFNYLWDHEDFVRV